MKRQPPPAAAKPGPTTAAPPSPLELATARFTQEYNATMAALGAANDTLTKVQATVVTAKERLTAATQGLLDVIAKEGQA